MGKGGVYFEDLLQYTLRCAKCRACDIYVHNLRVFAGLFIEPSASFQRVFLMFEKN